MAFLGNGTRLTGNDGFLQHATFGAAIAGDGATPLPAGFYFITAVAAVSSFPAPAEGGDTVTAGRFIYVTSSDVITPAIGDDVITMTLEDRCDVSSWTMDFTAGEIETTTSCDEQKKYRSGRPDMTGTIEGVFQIGTTDAVDGYYRQFIDIIRQDGDVSMDVFEQASTILLGVFYANKKTSLGDLLYVVAPFQIQGMSLGGAQEAAQTFSAGFRFAAYNEPTNDIPINPAFYRIGDGS